MLFQADEDPIGKKDPQLEACQVAEQIPSLLKKVQNAVLVTNLYG